jgi:hypothetical protein
MLLARYVSAPVASDVISCGEMAVTKPKSRS